jgi:hypothetical protein
MFWFIFLLTFIIGLLVGLSKNRTLNYAFDLAYVVVGALMIFFMPLVGLLFIAGGIALLVWDRKKFAPLAPSLRTPDGIARTLTGTSVTQGRTIGYKITNVSVIEGTIREHDRKVYADADLTLSNGETKHAIVEGQGKRLTWHEAA